MAVDKVGQGFQITYQNPVTKKTVRLGTLATKKPYSFAEEDDARICSAAMKAIRVSSKKAADHLVKSMETARDWTLNEVQKGLDVYFLELGANHLLRQRTMMISMLMKTWKVNQNLKLHEEARAEDEGKKREAGCEELVPKNN